MHQNNFTSLCFCDISFSSEEPKSPDDKDCECFYQSKRKLSRFPFVLIEFHENLCPKISQRNAQTKEYVCASVVYINAE